MEGKRSKRANGVTWTGFFVNLALTAFKLLAGIVGHSGAMVADAMHSLSDFATDIVVLVSFKVVSKPVDKDHDYGHGKYETLATALIGGALLVVGAGIFRGGALNIWESLQGRVLDRPRGVALAAALLSIGVKEWLYRLTRRAGEEIGSPAVIANAWHHRSDAFSSIGTALGIGGALLLGDAWRVLDPVAAVGVSLFIVKVAVQILSGSVRELMDQSLDDATETEIVGLAADVAGVSHPHNLRTRRIGSTIAIDLHIRVDPSMSVVAAHGITTQIEEALRTRFGSSSFISIHVEPESSGVSSTAV